MNADSIRQGIDRLERRRHEVEKFNPSQVSEQYNIPEIDALGVAIDEALTRTFGSDTADYRRYSGASNFDNGPHNYAFPVPITSVQQSLARSKARSIALLTQAITALKERLEELPENHASKSTFVNPLPFERKVFIVHGRDEGPREAVARFLESIGIEPIILHEQANRGRTVIEKVVAHGELPFAVVLLTPDDFGGANGEQSSPRPRQNVLLELGYFIGRLGRENVCALKKGDMELPSDFGGVVYEKFDSGGGWKQTLARELQAVGYEIDWNAVMRPTNERS
ncbi:MAG: TIR domain-containing protein [Methylocystis sp.]|uniref:TIR domain-containing protein n=1 Tax=Methylocystis sp. TaxID=1911079 RepID=UPI003DA34FEE